MDLGPLKLESLWPGQLVVDLQAERDFNDLVESVEAMQLGAGMSRDS